MISIITPAYNEERFIEKCLYSVKAAAKEVDEVVEHIVVLNRCTDNTGEIASRLGAGVIIEDSKNLSRIRNKGVEASKGDIIVTLDADSQMTSNMLVEVKKNLDTGKFIGGGVKILPERISLGIIFSLAFVAPLVLWHRVSAGMFWCLKKDFNAIGGFDENLACIEDIDFGKRLKRYGQHFGKHYYQIRKAHIVTSCRKFDQFGDWYFIKNPMVVYRIFKRDQKQADQFYYDARSEIIEPSGGADGKKPRHFM